MTTRPMTVTLSCTALLLARLLYSTQDDFTHFSEETQTELLTFSLRIYSKLCLYVKFPCFNWKQFYLLYSVSKTTAIFFSGVTFVPIVLFVIFN